MKYSEQNWAECLESLGFTEQKSSQFGGMTVFNDKGIPCWTYTTEEEKRDLYLFFSGAAYWKVHTMLA